MKKLRLLFLFLLIFINNCAENISTINKPQGTISDFEQAPKLKANQLYYPPSMLWNNSQYLRFLLSDNEKKKHQSAVMYALSNSADGSVISWYSEPGDLVYGKVRIVNSYPTSAGYCRVYQSIISVMGSSRASVNKGCKEVDLPWRFIE